MKKENILPMAMEVEQLPVEANLQSLAMKRREQQQELDNLSNWNEYFSCWSLNTRKITVALSIFLLTDKVISSREAEFVNDEDEASLWQKVDALKQSNMKLQSDLNQQSEHSKEAGASLISDQPVQIQPLPSNSPKQPTQSNEPVQLKSLKYEQVSLNLIDPSFP